MRKVAAICLVLLHVFIFQAKSDEDKSIDLGGIAGFQIFYAKDTIAYQDIKLKTLYIDVFLYRGFAVIESTCELQNFSKDKINLYLGCPSAISFLDKNLGFIKASSIIDFKIKVDDKEIRTTLFNKSDDVFRLRAAGGTLFDAGYLWQMGFKPKKSQTLKIYAVINTDSYIRQDDKEAKGNALAYDLRPFARWENTIESGRIFVRLMDQVTTKYIRTISPSGFKSDLNDKLLYTFANLEPNENFNLLIRYKKTSEPDYKIIKNSVDSLYQAIEMYEEQALSDAQWNSFSAEDYTIKSWYEKFTVNAAFFFMVLGVPVLLIGIVLLLILLIVKRAIKKQKKKA